MTTHPQPPPEALLIRSKRDSPPSMTIRHAADLAGMSEGRWRQLENGGWKRRGRWETEIAPARTLALMARAVGLTPRELESVRRHDAAAELAALPPLETPQDPVDELRAYARALEQRIAKLEGRDDQEGESNGHRNAI